MGRASTGVMLARGQIMDKESVLFFWFVPFHALRPAAFIVVSGRRVTYRLGAASGIITHFTLEVS